MRTSGHVDVQNVVGFRQLVHCCRSSAHVKPTHICSSEVDYPAARTLTVLCWPTAHTGSAGHPHNKLSRIVLQPITRSTSAQCTVFDGTSHTTCLHALRVAASLLLCIPDQAPSKSLHSRCALLKGAHAQREKTTTCLLCNNSMHQNRTRCTYPARR